MNALDAILRLHRLPAVEQHASRLADEVVQLALTVGDQEQLVFDELAHLPFFISHARDGSGRIDLESFQHPLVKHHLCVDGYRYRSLVRPIIARAAPA